MKKIFYVLAIILLVNNKITAQENNKFSTGEIHGNFQMMAQNYLVDSTIGAKAVNEKIRMNSFANLNFIKGNFKAGIRYESYEKALLGFDPRYNGSDITYRYATYTNEDLEFTIGNFYEQFGSGLIFRSYEERGLGIDNAMDGIRVKYKPTNGVYLKGIVGKQRFYFAKGEGIVRGLDAEFNLNEIFSNFLPEFNPANARYTYILGGSMVGKYQADNDPIRILPENVAAFSGRLNFISDKFNFYTEYANKINDPSLTNGFIYKRGEALFLSANYSVKGFSLSASAKRVDNMDFRSDRNADVNNLTLSFLPAISKQHTYALPAFYPYATQPLGEIGEQFELSYNFKKGSKLGGKYGTLVTINFSNANNLDTTQTGNEQGYTAAFFRKGETLLYRDLNIEVVKKISPKLKTTYTYMYQVFNKDRVQNVSGYGTVFANIAVFEMQYKINSKNTFRAELQSMRTKQDFGDWAVALAEYTVSPHWFFAALDQYNYGNAIAEKRAHYYSGSFGYTKNATRFIVGYGKQREGYLCVGGVCRLIPASYGLSLSISSTF
jgi:hypothetical protein